MVALKKLNRRTIRIWEKKRTYLKINNIKVRDDKENPVL